MSRHPIQPLENDGDGVIRFKQNRIVRTLLDKGSIDLNDLARMGFDNEDHEQFAQLIGYSLGGLAELDYVSDETYDMAESQILPRPGTEHSRVSYHEKQPKSQKP